MEQRRNKRFTIRLPLSVTRTGEEPTMRTGHTRNISAGGVLFSASEEPKYAGERIEYLITLHEGEDRPVNLRCAGRVVRIEPEGSGSGSLSYNVAATLDRYEFVRSE